jgi:hypothetical protein
LRKFIIKILLLGIPAYLYAAFIILVDPYNYFGISPLVENEIKERATYTINPVLGNMLAYKNNPVPSITISDSRFAHKDLKRIKNITGIDFFELYAHDGLIQEFLSFFRFADTQIKLENVYICINFSAFSETKRNNLVESANSIINNPFLYIFNRNVAESSVICLMSKIFQAENHNITKPSQDKTTFWKNLLNTTEIRFYKNYIYPAQYIHELKEISLYCKANNIKLYIIIPPTNTEMQELIRKNNLDSYRERFVNELSGIAGVYDMDFLNPITSDSSLYLDPNHLQKEWLSDLFGFVISNKPDSLKKYVKITGPGN